MKKLQLICLILVFTFPAFSQEELPAQPEPEEYRKGYFEQIFGFPINDAFNAGLYETIYNWLGTPYRYAGRTLKGIDCSNFVNEIYKSACGYILGGNSAEQFARTQRIKKEELQEGDLVFFRTNKKRISHVGIYLCNDKFVHSSRSKGVIISDLNHSYYKSRYAGAGRLQF